LRLNASCEALSIKVELARYFWRAPVEPAP
jgi:hypothetical protein